MMRFLEKGPAGGDCTRYAVELDRTCTLKDLFDAIRSDRPIGESGSVLVKIGMITAGPAEWDVEYVYEHGVFSWRQRPKKKIPDDLIDHAVTRVTASGGWGRMDYYVNVRQ